jgi:hypothetical protein
MNMFLVAAFSTVKTDVRSHVMIGHKFVISFYVIALSWLVICLEQHKT